MPRRYWNAPSGNELSKRLRRIALKFLRFFILTRENGNVTPKKAICGSKLAEMFGIREVEVWMLISYWREQRVPIASGKRGYFLAVSRAELESTVRQLTDRRNWLAAVIGGLRYAMDVLPDKTPSVALTASTTSTTSAERKGRRKS